jgi:hypothetical protein
MATSTVSFVDFEAEKGSAAATANMVYGAGRLPPDLKAPHTITRSFISCH